MLRIFQSSKNLTHKLLKTENFVAVPLIHISLQRKFSTTSQYFNADKHYKLLVVGGGSGGCSVAAKFSKKINPSSIGVVEPSDTHYYQPLWTLVGAGLKSLSESGKPMKETLPSNIDWIKDSVVEFQPDKNLVKLGNGKTIGYEYLVVALGIELKYNQIKGLPEAFATPGVCSNYSRFYVNKTYEALQTFEKGNAIFTFPNTPVKCPGAPQKILYLAEDYFRRTGKLKDTNLIYNTSLGVIFGVKHYADALWEVVKKRGNIEVNLRHNLVEVIPKHKKAIFQNLDNPNDTKILDYSFLHISPPQGAYNVLKQNSEMTDSNGFLNVKKDTLQHVKFENIFGLGDCTNSPNSKTAAAVAAQSGVLFGNLCSVMNNGKPSKVYDGYASCPLVTSSKTCILAEFDYNLQPLETFPINQAKERYSMYYLKRDIMPRIYWDVMMKGYWNGPKTFRKLMHLGLK